MINYLKKFFNRVIKTLPVDYGADVNYLLQKQNAVLKMCNQHRENLKEHCERQAGIIKKQKGDIEDLHDWIEALEEQLEKRV